jgi:sporulation protein YlmC with PRC-barrel domain
MARHQQARLRRFERMSALKNYTVEKGLADPRGWKVVDAAGQRVGQVQDLVIDTDRMAAVYLDVALDTGTFGMHDDPVILVPMSRAERAGGHNELVVRDLTRSRITALFEARAAHEAAFWENWWRDEGAEPTPVSGIRDEHVAAPVRRAIENMDHDTPRDPVYGPGETIRMDPDERIAARDLDEPRQGLPADAPPAYRRDTLDEPDPLEDPHYRRPPTPGERRRFDE